MSAWPAPPAQRPSVQLPPGYAVAGMGRRTVAWIVDGFILGLVNIIPVILAFATGAVTFNQQAFDQINETSAGATYEPFANVTVPFIHANMGPLIVAIVVYVVLQAAYFAGSWLTFGGTPAQLILNLRVVRLDNGRNLTIPQSLLRWGLITGISGVIGAIFLAVMVNYVATTPVNEIFGEGGTAGMSFASGSFLAVNMASNLVSIANALWVVVLLVTTAQEASHRGLHDRIVGSVVLGPLSAVAAAPGYGYPGQQAHWPPPPSPWTAAPTPPYPWYPSQVPPYPAQVPGAPVAPPYPAYPYPGRPLDPRSAGPAGQAGPAWAPAPPSAPAAPPPPPPAAHPPVSEEPPTAEK